MGSLKGKSLTDSTRHTGRIPFFMFLHKCHRRASQVDSRIELAYIDYVVLTQLWSQGFTGKSFDVQMGL